MLKGMTLQQLGSRLEEEQNLKADFVAPADKLSMTIKYGDVDEKTRQQALVPMLSIFDGKRDPYYISQLCHDQIGSRLGIPAKYYDRMLATQPELLSLNVNTWLREAGRSGEKRMVRTMAGRARAFLSNRYNRIENAQILRAAMPSLARIPGARVVSCEVTEKRMYMQIVSEKIQGEVRRGDVVQAGVVISNSEVGAGSVSVQSLDYRLVCLNGMITSQMLRAYHVGRRIEDNDDLWQDDTRRADDNAILLKVRDMVAAAVDETRFRERIDRMRGLTKIELKGDPKEAVELLSAKIGATDEETSEMLRALIKGADLSAWGMVNAVTAAAHKARSYDRCVELEQAGGSLLDLSKKDWSAVLEAGQN